MARPFLHPIEVPRASATDCAVQFPSDPNTGVYSPSADVLAFCAGGEAMRLDTSQRLLIHATVSRNTGGSNKILQVEELTAAAGISVVRNTAASAAPALLSFGRSRAAAIGSFSALTTAGDDVGQIEFLAADGTSLVSAVEILAEIDAATSTGIAPGRLSFRTADAAGVMTEVMRLNAAQRMLIGGTSDDGTNKVQVTGSLTVSSQLKSTVSTGTSPLTVASTTVVTNLNADLLDGFNASTTGAVSTVAVRDSSGHIIVSDNARFGWSAAATVYVVGDEAGGSMTLRAGNTNVNINNAGGVNITFPTGTVIGLSTTGIDRSSGSAETFNFQNSGAGAMTLQVDGNTVWHAGNDGAASGLDADLLDGLNTATANTASTIVARDANARFQAANPSAAQDVATKDYVDTSGGLTSTVGRYGAVGINCFNNTGTPNTQYDMDADVVILRDSSNRLVVVNSPSTVTNNVSTAGSTAGGRDQAGAFSASSWIHFYWIWNGSTLSSVSSTVAPPTGPTLPSGYTHWAYAGAVRFNGSSQLVKTKIVDKFAHYGDDMIALNASTGNTTPQALDLSPYMPPNSQQVQMLLYLRSGSAGIKIFRVYAYDSLVHFVRTELSTENANDTILMGVTGQAVSWDTNTTTSVSASIYIRGYSVPN